MLSLLKLNIVCININNMESKRPKSYDFRPNGLHELKTRKEIRDYYYGCIENDYVNMFLEFKKYFNWFCEYEEDEIEIFCKFDAYKLYRYHTFGNMREYILDPTDFATIAASYNSPKIACNLHRFRHVRTVITYFSDVEIMYKYFNMMNLKMSNYTNFLIVINLLKKEKFDFVERLLNDITFDTKYLIPYYTTHELYAEIFKYAPDYLIAKFVMKTDFLQYMPLLTDTKLGWKRVRGLVDNGIPIESFIGHKYYDKLFRNVSMTKHNVKHTLDDIIPRVIVSIICGYI